MTKKSRTVLFLICLILFLIIAPLAIFYSQGYRFDFETKKITQTGGLFLKVIPKQVEVFVDGKLTKKTDFFFGSALIENLLPKKYRVSIKKERCLPWEKNLEIREKEVTEAKDIILFPEDPNLTILTKDVEDFWLSPDERKIVIREKGQPNWALKLYDLEKNVKSHLITDGDFYPKGVDLLTLDWSQDSKKISLEVGVREEIKYFTLELDKVPPVLSELKAPPGRTEDIVAEKIFNGEHYYLDNFGNLFRGKEKLTEKVFPVKAETDYDLEIFQNFVFLREEKTLYKFNSDSKSFEKFFEEINDLKISPDSKKMVYFSNQEVWVLFLKDVVSQPEKKAGERILIARLSEKIGDIFWLNNNYLIFNAGDKIKISEIDDRDRINIVDIAEIKKPPQESKLPTGQAEIFWNSLEKKLYVLSEGNLYRSKILLP